MNKTQYIYDLIWRCLPFIILFIFLVLSQDQSLAQCPTCSGGPAPQGDECNNAVELDTLPAPNPCNGGAQEGVGDTVNFSLTNVCATPGQPYLKQTSCQTGNNNMASPADDIWTRVYITGSKLYLSLNSGLSNTNVGIWEGNSCNSITGVGCARTSGGNLTTTFSGLNTGYHYIQISGESPGDQCDMSLDLSNGDNCQKCVVGDKLQVTPQPTNGSYPSNTTVEFCYTIDWFNEVNSNYLHGVKFDLGDGWDMSSIVTKPASSCDGLGAWGWYDTVISTGSTPNDTIVGPGFFYERGNLPNTPGDNFGDNCDSSSATNWQFCIEISTPTCSPGDSLAGSDLGLEITTFGDGETGAWNMPTCASDPKINFNAILYCCSEPMASSSSTTCPGGNDGRAFATGNGYSPWNYTWRDTGGTVLRDTGQVFGPDTLTNLSAGNYYVEVEDSTGCTGLDTVTVSDPPDWQTSFDTTNVSCNGGSDGAIDLTVNGANPPYTYSWSNGANNQDITNLDADTFTVTISDSLSCTYTDSAVVNEPPGISLSASVTDVTCHDSTGGSIDLSVTGGSTPYSYSWSGGSQTQDTMNIGAGTYKVTVTDDNGCQRIDSFTVDQPPPITIDTTVTNVTCYGNQDGAIDLAVSGGTGSYTYAWSGGSATQDTVGVQAGTYTVTVTDANGCSVSQTAYVDEPDSLITQADSIPVPCYGNTQGKAIALPNGGVTPYSYSWDDPSSQQDSIADGLAPSTYTVTVTDDNNCVDSAKTVVTEPDSLQIDLDTTHVTCNNGSDGAVSASVSGGTTPYNYQWSNGASGQNINNLSAGNYCLTVTDTNNCTKVACAQVNEPSPISLSTSSRDANCEQPDGWASVSANGGLPPYTYQWDDQAQQQTDTASNLTPGNYQVVVTDSVGCQDSSTVTVGNIPGPTATITSSSNVSCFNGDDGSATVSVSGGTTPYTYQWDDSLSQTTPTAANLRADTTVVTVTDSNNCIATDTVVITEPPPLMLSMDSLPTYCQQDSGAAMVDVTGGTTPYSYQWDDPNNQTSDSANNLGQGIYTVTVTDANNCTANDSVEVPNLSGGTLVITDSSHVSCFGGSDGRALAEVINGAPPYSYQWNDPANQTTDSATNLSAGTYGVTVTESNGCRDSTTVTIDEPSQPLSLTLSADSATCNNSNGRAFVEATGGTSPYSYQWDDPGSQTDDTADGLASGLYHVTVTDTNGCTAEDSVYVGDYPPGTLSLSVVQDVQCPAGRDGEATASVSGGTSPFTYAWDDSLNQNTPTADSLAAGTYTVTVTDSVGCVLNDSITLTQPPPFQTTMDSTTTDCGQANGSASVSVSGGTSPYNYQWDDQSQQTTPTATNLPVGTYNVTVTDAQNCTTVDSVEVTNPNLGTPSITHQDVSCFGGSDGLASVSISGGTPPFSYQWNDPANQDSSTATGLSKGSYNVTVTDDAGCTVEDSVTIDQPQAPLTVDSSGTSSATCGNANGTAFINVSGGTVDSTYSYQWNDSNSQTTAFANQLAEGSYTVTITDDNGCTITNSLTIDNIPGPTLQTQSTPVTCYGGTDGSAVVTISGGTSPYQTEWSNGEQGDTIDNVAAGDYEANVTDANNCQASQTVTVGSPPEIIVDAGPDQTIKLGQETTLSGTITGLSNVQTYSWQPQNDINCAEGANAQQCLQPTVAPRDTTTYTLTAIDNNNCQYQDTTRVIVIIEPNIYAPNAFSPNKDDVNDEFKLITRKVQDYKLQIFNRWGEKLFQTSDPDEGWDGTYKGKEMPPDVYVYVAYLKYTTGKREVQNGSVTLIR